MIPDRHARFFDSFHFFSIDHFLSAEECGRLRDVMSEAPAADATVAKQGGEYHVDDAVRRTRRVSIPSAEEAAFVARLDAIRDAAASHFGVTLSDTEQPQFLVYREGDFFVRHADRDRGGANRRAVSLVVFINDDFEGGSLRFFGEVDGEQLALNIEPAAGLLIAFRSETPHEVEAVRSGVRFTAVSWFL